VPQKRDLREADQKFLDALVQKQKRDRDTLPTLVQNIGPGGTIDSANMSVPRAELVVNSAIVKRAELVVRSGKRKRQSITTSLHRSQIPKDL
jgi:hypothetical protein